MSEHAYETDASAEGFWSGLGLRSAIAKSIFSLALTGTVASMTIALYEAMTAAHGPRSPDSVHGLVAPFNNHGTLVYISTTHSLWLNTAFFVFFPCLIVTLFFVIRSRSRKS
jgi:hypothetical protein